MRRHAAWTLLGLALAYMMYVMVAEFVDVLVYSVFIYYVSRPVYWRLKGGFKSEMAAAFVSVFILLMPVTFVTMYSIGVASAELANFTADSELPYRDSIVAAAAGYSSALEELGPEDLVGLGQSSDMRSLWDIASYLAVVAMGALVHVMLTFIIALYLLVDGWKLRRWLSGNLYPHEKRLTDRYMSEVDEDLHKVFSGNILTAFVIVLIGAVSFILLDAIAPPNLALPYPLLMGMICGVTSLVPMFGVALFWVPAAFSMAAWSYVNGGLAEDLWFIALFTAVSAVVVDWGPNLLFKPRITGRRIHPGLMMLAYLFGPLAFGIAGLFLGPIVLVLAVNFVKVVLPELRR